MCFYVATNKSSCGSKITGSIVAVSIYIWLKADGHMPHAILLLSSCFIVAEHFKTFFLVTIITGSVTVYIMYICNISWCCCDLETWHTRRFERATVFNSFRDHQCLSLCVEVLPQLSWKDSISIETVFMFNS